MAASRTAVRRRQRNNRVTASVAMLSVATLAVLAALPTRSALWLGLVSVGAVALGWGALRVLCDGVAQSRRENAADRAAAAVAYSTLFRVRTAEHEEFTAAMTARLADAHLAQRELEGLLTQHETHVQRAQSRLGEAQARIRDLEEAMRQLGDDETRAVVDLVEWDERTGQKIAHGAEQRAVKAGPPALKRA